MWQNIKQFVEKNKYVILAVIVVFIFGLIYYKYSEHLTIESGDGDSDAGLCRESCAHCRRNCPFKRYNGVCECSYCDNNKCPFGN